MGPKTKEILKSAFATTAIVVSSISFGFSQSLSGLAWLSGDWVCKSGKAVTTESWSFMNDSTLFGSSVTMENGKMTAEEALRIESRNGVVRYIAVLPLKIATFSFEEKTKNSYSFVDSENDFPSKITYRKTKSGLLVELEGSEKQQKQNFVKKK